MADRQIGEDEITSQVGTVQVGHTGDGHASEDGDLRHWRLHASVGNRASDLEGGEEEEVGVVGEGHIALALEDTQLDDGRRIDWSSIGRGCR